MGTAPAGAISRIDPQGTRLTDLAEQARVAKQPATHLVDQIERAGYAVPPE
jgi:DNA-binding MarR family transcriptional regulator